MDFEIPPPHLTLCYGCLAMSQNNPLPPIYFIDAHEYQA